MSDIKRDAENQDLDTSAVEADENREAAAEGETEQDFRAERDTAEGHTAFGDDRVTPRLNDGR